MEANGACHALLPPSRNAGGFKGECVSHSNTTESSLLSHGELNFEKKKKKKRRRRPSYDGTAVISDVKEISLSNSRRPLRLACSKCHYLIPEERFVTVCVCVCVCCGEDVTV